MIALLLRKYWGVALAVALAGWVMLACHQRDVANIARGRAEEHALQLEAHLAVLELKATHDSLRADSLARAVAVDTVRLAAWFTRWDTVTTTVNIHDTVSVALALATSDSTIRSCKATVSDLLSSCAAKDTVIADLRAINATLRAATPVPTKPRSWHVGVGPGYALTYDRTSGRVVDGPSLVVSLQWSPLE